MKLSLLSSLEIDSPCPIALKKLDPEVRTWFCNQCNLNVHNVSNMTAKEAETFLRERTGSVCVSIKRKADGRIYTDNCPRILRAVRRRMIKVATMVGITILIQLIGKVAVAQGLVGAPVDPRYGQGGCGPAEPDTSIQFNQSIASTIFSLSCLPAVIALLRAMGHQFTRASTPMQLAKCILGFLIAAGFAAVVFSSEYNSPADGLSWSSFCSHIPVAIMGASIILGFITLWKLAKVATSILAVSILVTPDSDAVGHYFGTEHVLLLALCGISICAWTNIFLKKDVQQYLMKAGVGTSMSMIFGPIMLLQLTETMRHYIPACIWYQTVLDLLKMIIPDRVY